MAAISDLSKIPPGLQRDLPHPRTPWKISNQVFEKLAQQPWAPNLKFKKCVLLPEDPECAFVLKYFHHQKPANYGIARIYCLHQPSLTGKFEEHLQTIRDLFFTTACTHCHQDLDGIDHFLINHSSYSIKGRTVKDNQLIEIPDAKISMTKGAMLSRMSDWKYININLK